METGIRYRFGPFLLDPRKRLLLRNEQEVPLYGKAFDTLLLLVRNSDRLVKKDQLLKEVWSNRVVEENNLSQSISATRKALDDTTQPHIYIVTVPAWGYRFAAPVSLLREPEESPVTAPEATPEQPAAPSVRVVTRSRSGRLTLMGLVLGAILVSVGLLWARFGSVIFVGSGVKTAVASPARRSVAIVGFRNLSGHKEDAWVSAALAEMLNTELAAGEQLRVISQEDVARANTEVSLAIAGGAPKNVVSGFGKSLGSDLVVSGVYSIIGEKSDKQVRFDLRLQNGHSGETVAEIAETGSQTELFGLVSQAGARLRQKLNISELSPTETLAVRASLPKDPDAARLYAEGLAKLRMFDAIGATDRLQKAINLDPDYSLAHSALAEAWSVLGYDAKSRDEAEKAFQHSGGLSRQDRLSVEGQYRIASADWAKAVEAYKTLFGLFPDDLDYGLHLASAQIKASGTDDGLATLKVLRRLPAPAGNDPRIGLTEYEAWRSLSDFKHMEDAVAQAAEKAKQQGELLLLARARIRQCALQVQRSSGEQEQALKNCREAQQIFVAAGDRRGEAEVLRVFGDAAAVSNTAEAIDYYQKALSLEQEIGHLSGQAAVMTQLATEHSSQGDHLAAKRSYEKALAILQQLGDKEDATGLMIDIGGELVALGQVEQAAKMYRDARELASAEGNKYLQALAESNAGLLQQLEGDLQGAQESYTRSLEWLRQLGSKEYDIALTKDLGEVALAKADFAGARALYEKAMSMQQVSQQKLSAAEVEMDLDELTMEEGQQCASIERSLRRIVDLFGTGNDTSGVNAVDDQALSVALLARCQLSQGQSTAALQTIERAVKISAKTDPSVRLSIVIAAARIHFAAEPGHDESRAAGDLTRAINEARELHYLGVELEGRLALGEVEVRSGALSRGRSRLQSVERDASRRGFTLLARKAKVAA
ncbi:MAG: tetratricopeptide repeat protein [Terriglobales bacterium]